MAFVMQESGANQLMPSVSFSPNLGGGDAVSAGGGGGGGPGDPFDMEGGRIVRCELVFGRLALTCEDTEIAALGAGVTPQGVVYASIAHAGSDEPTLSVKHADDLPPNGLDVTNRALYRAVSGRGGGTAWADVRRAITVVAMAS